MKNIHRTTPAFPAAGSLPDHGTSSFRTRSNDLFRLTHSRHPVNAELKNVLASLDPVLASHEAVLRACRHIVALTDHAVARGFFHPGIDRFRKLMKGVPVLPRAPHGSVFDQAMDDLRIIVSLEHERKLREWKEKAPPLVAKMKACEESLKTIMDERAVKQFVAIEEEVLRREDGRSSQQARVPRYPIQEPGTEESRSDRATSRRHERPPRRRRPQALRRRDETPARGPYENTWEDEVLAREIGRSRNLPGRNPQRSGLAEVRPEGDVSYEGSSESRRPGS